jgi:LysR family hydrogen peroxide-inducible transcriptional activator
MKTLPSLKQLEYLAALADEKHFGKAAEACNVTPSTLSAGIKELEMTLGVVLAERTKRTVLMTPVGMELASRGRQLLCHAQDLMDLAASSRTPLVGELRLGVIPTIGPFLFPHVLPALQDKFPALRLFLREETTDELLAKLRCGELDAAVIALPYEIEGLCCRSMFEDPFQLACPEGHALSNEKLVDQKDLEIQTLLLLEEGHCLRGHALDACRIAKKKRRSEFEATSLYTIVQMVSAGLGITPLPQIAIDDNITRGTKIRLVPLIGAPSRQIGLVWRNSSSRSEEFALLGDALTPDEC